MLIPEKLGHVEVLHALLDDVRQRTQKVAKALAEESTPAEAILGGVLTIACSHAVLPREWMSFALRPILVPFFRAT
jgi:hypothetical protein